ncbi:cupin domain-containing protein [Endothiovibrio diazotrophicus]
MIQNLFQSIPTALPEEFMETLAGGDGCRVERIVSRGHRSPDGFWYDQEEREWVTVLKGAARLRIERDGITETVEMGPGDWIDLPAHTRHRVEWTDPDADTVWLAVFYR